MNKIRRTESYLVAIHIKETTTYFNYENKVNREEVLNNPRNNIGPKGNGYLNDIVSNSYHSLSNSKEHKKSIRFNLQTNLNSAINLNNIFNEELNSPIHLFNYQNSFRNETQKDQVVFNGKIDYHTMSGYFLVLILTLVCYYLWLFWFNLIDESSHNNFITDFFQCLSCTLIAFCFKSPLRLKISKILLILSSIFIYFVIIVSYFLKFLSFNFEQTWIFKFLSSLSVSLLVISSIRLTIHYITVLDRSMKNDQKHVLIRLAKRRYYSYKSKVFMAILLTSFKLDWSILFSNLFKTKTPRELSCLFSNTTYLSFLNSMKIININQNIEYTLRLIIVSIVFMILTLFFGLFLVYEKEFEIKHSGKNELKHKRLRILSFLQDILVVFFYGLTNVFYRILLQQV